MLLGIPFSGVAMISSITCAAAVIRSAIFVLSSSARADREEAAMVKPHKTTDSFLIIFVIPFASTVQFHGVGPKSCLFPTLYEMRNRQRRLPIYRRWACTRCRAACPRAVWKRLDLTTVGPASGLAWRQAVLRQLGN